MAGKKDISDLMDQVQATPGWRVDRTSGKHYKCVNETTGEFVVVPVTPSDYRTYPNVVAQLRRRGWDENAAQTAKDDDRAERLAADKARGEALLAAAQDDIEAELRRAEADRVPEIVEAPSLRVVATPFLPPVIPQAKIFVPSAPPELDEDEDDEEESNPMQNISAEDARTLREALARCRSEFLEITQLQADKWLEKGPCRQRDVGDTDVAKLRRAIERGRFYGNPADHIVLDIHGCCINGQHRLYAWLDTPEDVAQAMYPNGLPIYVTYDCPPELAKIFDTGRRRSPKDALDVEKMPEFGRDGSAVMRLIANLDGGKPWQSWNKEIWVNDDFTEMAAGPMKGLPPYLVLGRAIARDSGLNRIVAAATAFMIDRDNPEGGPIGDTGIFGTNEDFWNGVRFKISLAPNDPRAALYKFCKDLRADKTKTIKTPILAGHVFRQYANWHIGNLTTQSKQDEDWRIFPVWRPGFRIIAGELRLPEREWKARKTAE